MAAGEIRTCVSHSCSTHVRRIGIDHHGSAEISTTQIGRGEVGIAELHIPQISAVKTCTAQIGSFEIGGTQIGISEIGIAKVSTDQMGTLKMGRSKITTCAGTTAEQSLPGGAMRLNNQWFNTLSAHCDRYQSSDQESSNRLSGSKLIHGSSGPKRYGSLSLLDNLVALCRGPENAGLASSETMQIRKRRHRACEFGISGHKLSGRIPLAGAQHVQGT
tara:strand:- start:39 stop:692 length:654 start_codon:yes stop_codon:yes gene_type:complete